MKITDQKDKLNKTVVTGAFMYPAWSSIHSNKGESVSSNGVNEWLLLEKPRKYFKGHRPPGKPLFGTYSASDERYIDRVVRLCELFGISCIVVCWYWDNGKILCHECLEPLQRRLCGTNICYALMWVQRKPHNELPLKPPSLGTQYFAETEHRIIRTSYDDLSAMGTYLASEHFNNPKYQHINGCPVFLIFEVPNLIRDLGQNGVKDGILVFRSGVRKVIDKEVALFGIIHHRNDILPLAEYGFDAATSYVFLPDWALPNNQDYEKALSKRRSEWEHISDISGVPYIPSIAAGWDASPRGEHVSERPLNYPWTPIVTGVRPSAFYRALLQGRKYVEGRDGPQMIFVVSLNEWTEGHAIEPSIQYSFHFLEAIRAVNEYKKNTAAKSYNGLFVTKLINSELYKDSADGNKILSRLKEQGFLIVFMTSKTLSEAYEIFEHKETLKPDILVADLGVSIHSLTPIPLIEHPQWEKLVAFPRCAVEKVLESQIGLRPRQIDTEYRLSYVVDESTISKQSVEKALRSFPIQTVWTTGFLDVLPNGVDQGTCVESFTSQCGPASPMILVGNTIKDAYFFRMYLGRKVLRIYVGQDQVFLGKTIQSKGYVVKTLPRWANIYDVMTETGFCPIKNNP